MTGFTISRDQTKACYMGHDLVFEERVLCSRPMLGSCKRCAFRCEKIGSVRDIVIGRTFPCIPSARGDYKFGCWRPVHGPAGKFTS